MKISLFQGYTHPGLTLEVINEKTLDKIQVQADYKGFFKFEPLGLHAGDNSITWRVADQFYAEPAGRQIDVPHFNSANARYKPGTLEKIWHFIYKVIFPVLTTSITFWRWIFSRACNQLVGHLPPSCR